MKLPPMRRAAHLSDDLMQRFWLERAWGPDFPQAAPARAALWIMHNPSAADAEKDDPTIRRVIEFTQYWGLTRALVVNLIPRISATPADAHEWIDGGDMRKAQTVMYLRTVVMLADLAKASNTYPIIVAAWGGIARGDDVERFLREWRGTELKLNCIGLTAAGAPIHPLARGRNRPVLADPQPYWSPA